MTVNPIVGLPQHQALPSGMATGELSYSAATCQGRAMHNCAPCLPILRREAPSARADFFAHELWSTRSKRSFGATNRGRRDP